jgi:epoxyqueuosine reductase
MVEQLLAWAEARGYEVAWGPAEIIDQAAAEIRGRHESGELDGGLYASELASMVETGGAPASRTVIVVAVPRPAHRVHFELDDGSLPALLPPTYVRYRPLFEEVRQDLARHGLPGARVDYLAAPLKSIAARLGLVRYGRNNVTYTRGAGSYIQLCGFTTDAELPPAADAVSGPVLLDECVGCEACAGVCPTGAIGDERVLISAHRCLTFANENEGAWPGWAPGWAHTCLLGCLECQKVCPVNPPLEIEETDVVFSSAETAALLAGQERDRSVESGIAVKLAWLGQPYAESVLGRNLRALLEASGGPRPQPVR